VGVKKKKTLENKGGGGGGEPGEEKGDVPLFLAVLPPVT